MRSSPWSTVANDETEGGGLGGTDGDERVLDVRRQFPGRNSGVSDGVLPGSIPSARR